MRPRGITGIAANARALAHASCRMALVGLALASTSAAQDFAGAAPPGGEDDALALLERALPPASASCSAAAAQTRWWDLPQLETRAIAAGVGWRSARASLGLSQTGEPELGWTTLALAVGGATGRAGAGVRACTRRDRDAPWSASRAFAAGAGIESGAGAWLVPVAGLRVWASAPQMWTSGPAPPLARAMELGVRAGGSTGAWLRLVSPRPGDDGERALGLCIGIAPALAWAEVRDAPLRGAAGLAVVVGALHVEARVDAHPVLGETVRAVVSCVRAGHRGHARAPASP